MHAVPHPDRSIRPPMFVEITNKAAPWIVSQLVGKDAVHEFGARSEDELRAFRLGGPDTNKTCYALLDDAGALHAAIYVKRETHDVSAGYSALNGNVGKILHTPVEALSEAPRSLIFYSISNITNVRGMGQLLIRNLHAHLTAEYPGVLMSTLSPLRTLDTYLRTAEMDKENFAELSPALQRRIALYYLMQVQNGVQKFHMNNGATIGDIKLAADTIGTSRVMVNYIYSSDPEELARNARAFKDRQLRVLFAPELIAEAQHTNIFAVPAHKPSPNVF